MYASHIDVDVSRVRLLYERRAQTDARTLAEVFEAAAANGGKVPGNDEEVTFSVVVSAAPAGSAAPASGAASPPAQAPSAAPVAQGKSGTDVLRTDAFWSDLKGFLEQRIRDESVAGSLTETFKKAWESSR
jgi:ubiquitin-like protein 4